MTSWDTIKVFKIGGDVIDDSEKTEVFLSQFAKISGLKILVHGGGKNASKTLARLGIEPKMVDGRRVTDRPTLDVLTAVYGGYINKHLVAGLQKNRVNAIGLSGADANIVQAVKRSPTNNIDFGFVGDIKHVDEKAIKSLLALGLTPVFSPLSFSEEHGLLNTNADTVAAEIAKALCSAKDDSFKTPYNDQKSSTVELHFIFDLPGVMKDITNPDSKISVLTPTELNKGQKEGWIGKGMLPKLENAFSAKKFGVERVSIKPWNFGEAAQTGTIVSLT